MYSSFAGSSNMKWPGLNEPIKVKDDKNKGKFMKPQEERNFRHSRIDPSQRGWSGTTWPGRHAGAPQLANGGEFLKSTSLLCLQWEISNGLHKV